MSDTHVWGPPWHILRYIKPVPFWIIELCSSFSTLVLRWYPQRKYDFHLSLIFHHWPSLSVFIWEEDLWLMCLATSVVCTRMQQKCGVVWSRLIAFTVLFMRQRLSKSLCMKETGIYFNKDYVMYAELKKMVGGGKHFDCYAGGLWWSQLLSNNL